MWGNELVNTTAQKATRYVELLVEKPVGWGEFTLRGKVVEDRREIRVESWGEDWEREVMKVARSKMARRIIAGVEQWDGMTLSYDDEIGKCRFCKKRHVTNFEKTMMMCGGKQWDEARREIVRMWEAPHESLLFGRVPKTLFRKWVKEQGDLGRAYQGAKRKMRKWENLIHSLRRKLER